MYTYVCIYVWAKHVYAHNREDPKYQSAIGNPSPTKRIPIEFISKFVGISVDTGCFLFLFF